MAVVHEKRTPDGGYERTSYSPVGWAAAFAIVCGVLIAIFKK